MLGVAKSHRGRAFVACAVQESVLPCKLSDSWSLDTAIFRVTSRASYIDVSETPHRSKVAILTLDDA